MRQRSLIGAYQRIEYQRHKGLSAPEQTEAARSSQAIRGPRSRVLATKPKMPIGAQRNHGSRTMNSTPSEMSFHQDVVSLALRMAMPRPIAKCRCSYPASARLHGIVHHAIDQILKHFADASGGRHFLGVRNQGSQTTKPGRRRSRPWWQQRRYLQDRAPESDACVPPCPTDGWQWQPQQERRRAPGPRPSRPTQKAPQNAHGLSCARSNEGQEGCQAPKQSRFTAKST